MPPRTAYSPASRTVGVRRKPLASSQRTTLSMAICPPAAADQTSLSIQVRAGSRCTTALAVVSTTRGRSEASAETRRASAAMRRAWTAGFGDTRS